MKEQGGLQFSVGEIERGLYAKIVKKCGNRNHWADWANDIAKIANTHITRIRTIVSDERNTKEVIAFNAFADELRDDLNDSITDEEVIEMLAQHLITKPVFDALFSDYSFANNNPVSQAMQTVLDILQEHRLDKEADTLEKFYASVKMRAEGIDNAEGKQKIIVELYDKFFKNAFPRMAERLGIVYTPVEVVDFIIHSVNDLLQQEFGQSLGSEGVHILDPFTGTGTFITRLLQSGLISKEQLPNKYKNEIHCNEIVLLAYYIAAINIEAVYHAIMSDNGAMPVEHQPFEGICLTDTFQLYEKDDLISELLADNSIRRNRQKALDIRVIMGNPPYSAGQNSANDNNANVAYEFLDSRITDTYANNSNATNKNALYNSYIRAIRWASDRIGGCGVVGFVSGSGFADKSVMSGLRYCLNLEFSSIHIVNLRGDIRKNMLSKGRAKEGQNIFGSGSMTGIALSFLVKNPNHQGNCEIHYHDIGDDLKETEKLDALNTFKSVLGVSAVNSWQAITPDKHNDWINLRDESFDAFIKMGDKKGKNSTALFDNYSNGLQARGDAWYFNNERRGLLDNIKKSISFFNLEVDRYKKHFDKSVSLTTFVTSDSSQFSWYGDNIKDVPRGKHYIYNSSALRLSLYRPYTKTWLYYDENLMHRVGQMPRIFPTPLHDNLVICVSGVGARSGFTSYITNTLPCLDMVEKGQCFPLFIYAENKDDKIDFNGHDDLFAEKSEVNSEGGYTRKDGISDDGSNHFQQAYPSETFNKEDIFYYIYGLLHSPEYRERYADNLSKELPRIPCVKATKDFWLFSRAGRELAELHTNYETVEKFPVTLDCGKRTIAELDDEHFYVKKMKCPRVKNDEGKSVNDNSTIVYNDYITVRNIPLAAYDYVVNGKAAIEWVIDRQTVATDKNSGIINDANDWAMDAMSNAKYPLELLQRVISVSLETMKIVNNLPALDIEV